MRVVFFDTETTGLLEDSNTRVTEIACALVDFEERRVVESSSILCNLGVVIPEDITALTGITGRHLRDFGHDEVYCQAFVDYWFSKGDALFARNGVRFDLPMLKRSFQIPDRVLIDDYYDIEYPKGVSGRNLSHIAADHGFLNPFPHSAMGDTLTLAYVILKGKYDIKSAFESAKTSIVEVKAEVSFDDRDLAKQAGFSWVPEQKIWTKKMRKHKYEQMIEQKAWNFPTKFRLV